MTDEKFTLYVLGVNHPTQVFGFLKNNGRRVTATVPEAEGRRLIVELANRMPGMTGQEPPSVEVAADQLTSIIE